VLNHVSGHKAGIASVYNRATYEKEKKAALAIWADHLLAAVEGRPDNIVPLALMFFAVATLLDATAGRVLVLLLAIVLTGALLTAMLASLVTMLLALSTVTTLLLAALVLALAALLLATLLLVHEFLLRESCLACGNVSETRNPTVPKFY
jgi:hypothetical protein